MPSVEGVRLTSSLDSMIQAPVGQQPPEVRTACMWVGICLQQALLDSRLHAPYPKLHQMLHAMQTKMTP